MRLRVLLPVLAAGVLLADAPFADRDRFVTGSVLGVGSGKATGGLADHTLEVMLPGGLMVGTSGRCYQWTRSGRLVRARCP